MAEYYDSRMCLCFSGYFYLFFFALTNRIKYKYFLFVYFFLHKCFLFLPAIKYKHKYGYIEWYKSSGLLNIWIYYELCVGGDAKSKKWQYSLDPTRKGPKSLILKLQEIRSKLNNKKISMPEIIKFSLGRSQIWDWTNMMF